MDGSTATSVIAHCQTQSNVFAMIIMIFNIIVRIMMIIINIVLKLILLIIIVEGFDLIDAGSL